MTNENATIGVIYTKAMPKKSNGLVEEEKGEEFLFVQNFQY